MRPWAASQDQTLRELWPTKTPTATIAVNVGHCRSDVYKRAAQMGLPPRKRGWAGVRQLYWPPEVDEALTKLWGEGMGALAIGIELNMGRDAVSRRAAELGLPARTRQTRRKAPDTRAKLRCLKCSNPFNSVDKCRNRVCDECKESKRWKRGSSIYTTENSLVF